MIINLHVAHGCFHTTVAVLSSDDNNENIYCLVLHRKCLLIPIPLFPPIILSDLKFKIIQGVFMF